MSKPKKRSGTPLITARVGGLTAALALCVTFGLMAGSAGVAGASKTSTAASVALAKKGLLLLKDLPKGWTSSSSGNTDGTGGNGSFPGSSQLAGCLGISAKIIDADYPEAYSRDFNSKNQQLSVDDSVTVYPNAKDARASFSALGNAKTPSCLNSVLNGAARSSLTEGAPAGTTVGTIDVSRDPNSDFAPHSANFSLVVPFTYNEQVVNSEITVVDFVRGNEEQTVTLTTFEASFPTSLSRHVTGVADGRI